MVRDLQCGETSLNDPIDERVVVLLQQHYHFDLQQDFLAQMSTCHGAMPELSTFRVGSEQRHIGQFLTLLDHKSALMPPVRPHFDHDADERTINSIAYLVDGEHSTSRALFSGLMPFAATAIDMCLDRAYIDLVCLDYRENGQSPPVVLWVANAANTAYMDWDELPWDQQFGEEDTFLSVPWDDFLRPVSPNFTEFIQSLR